MGKRKRDELSSPNANPIDDSDGREKLPLSVVTCDDHCYGSHEDSARQKRVSDVKNYFNVGDNQAMRLIRGSVLRDHAHVRDTLKRFSALRVFDAWEFCSATPGVVHMEYDLSFFLNLLHVERASEAMQSFIQLLTPSVKEVCAILLLNFIAFASSVTVYLPVNEGVRPAAVSMALSRFGNLQWCTDKMAPQNGSRVDLVAAWNMASTFLSINVQDVVKSINTGTSHSVRVREEQFRERRIEWCQTFFAEVIAYCYGRVSGDISENNFIQEIRWNAGLAFSKFEKLTRPHGVAPDPAPILNMDRVRTSIGHVRRGHPVLAEIFYDSGTMAPSVNSFLPRRQSQWTAQHVGQRARTHPVHNVLSAGEIPNVDTIQTSHTSDEHGTTRAGSSSRTRPFDPPRSTAKPFVDPKSSTAQSSTSRAQQGTSTVHQQSRSSAARRATSQQPPAPYQSKYNAPVEPQWMTQSRFNPTAHYRLTHVRRLNEGPVANVNCEDDDADSDNEHDYFPANQRAHRNDFQQLDRGQQIELFYEQICSWIVDPASVGQLGHIFSQGEHCNAAWLRWFIQKDIGRDLKKNVTHVQHADDFIRHHLAFHSLNLRASVRGMLELNESMSALRDTPQDFVAQSIGVTSPFFQLPISDIRTTHRMCHVVAFCDNPDRIENILHHLHGLTLCLAFLSRNEDVVGSSSRRDTRPRLQRTRMMFAIVRGTVLDADNNPDLTTGDAVVERIRLTVTMSLKVLRSDDFVPRNRDTLRFIPLGSLAAELRIFRAIHDFTRLPFFIQRLLYGTRQLQINYDACNTTLPVSASTTHPADVQVRPPETAHHVRQLIDLQVDPGCLQYARNCLQDEDTLVSRAQFNAVIQALRVVGSAHPGTSGMYNIQGPPGTGKTSAILFLVGALLHHSVYGHIGKPQVDTIPQHRDRLRCATGDHPLRIMVVASSNAAVDNILRKIDSGGIPDGNGGALHPQLVRIARYGYELAPHLRQYSLHRQARTYDNDFEMRNFPTLPARRRFAESVIVFLSTVSAAGGSSWLELRQCCDVIIHDEAAATLEMEALVPLTNTRVQHGADRLFYIGVGDERQLPALSLAPHMWRRAEVSAKFNVDEMCNSMFERMITNQRCSFTMLTSQWRMHPAISRAISMPFYGIEFDCPLPPAHFIRPYNSSNGRSLRNGFCPMTFIDTSKAKNHGEHNAGQGRVSNPYEARVVCDVVRRLLQTPDVDYRDRIAIISPYHAQVDLIRQQLAQTPPLLGQRAVTKPHQIYGYYSRLYAGIRARYNNLLCCSE